MVIVARTALLQVSWGVNSLYLTSYHSA